MLRYTLKKKEILSSKKQIDELFSIGNSYFKFPIKLVYIIKDRNDSNEAPALFSISVPKRNIKTAVERNLIKRRVREAYRLNKQILYNKIPDNKQFVFMLIFIGKKSEKFDMIQNSLRFLMKRI